MLLAKLVLMLPIIFGFPELKMKWSSPKEDGLKIYISDQDPMLDDCIKSGFELRYRFEVQFCRKRTLWFSECKDRRLETHSLEFDAISDNYKLLRDRWDDQVDPETINLNSSEEAVEKMSTLSDLPLTFLAEGDADFAQSERTFVTAHVISECKGEYNRTLAKVSSLLTLGLLKISGFDSGWKDFVVRP